jgi:hypothetical protein
MRAPREDVPAQTPQVDPPHFPSVSDMSVHVKHALDAASTMTAAATITGWFVNALPPLAALASILWIGFQWYHSAPMKEWRDKRKAK